MKLTEHFSFEELTASEVALRHGVNNTPTDPQILGHLNLLAHKLEKVRELLGGPISISSAYRSSMVNTLVGSKPTSAHVKGLAADFTCPSFGTPKDIVEKIIKSNIDYDQVIYEYERWVHIGFSEEGYVPRKQALTIDNKGTRLYT